MSYLITATDCVGLLSYLISVSCISSVRHIIIALLGRRRLLGIIVGFGNW